MLLKNGQKSVSVEHYDVKEKLTFDRWDIKKLSCELYSEAASEFLT